MSAAHELVGSPTDADLEQQDLVRCGRCHELESDDLAVETYDACAVLCSTCADVRATCAGPCGAELPLSQLCGDGRICAECDERDPEPRDELPIERAIEPSAARWGW